MKKVIIDIVGLPCSGKSSICRHIHEKYGFELYSPSDALRAYAKRHGRTLTNRQDYIDCHAALIKDDPMAIIQPVFDSRATHLCLDGMRAPAPFLKLREEFGAILIYLDCPIEIRFARSQADPARSGHRLQSTLESFRADETPDYSNPDPHLPNMTEMKCLADYVIDVSAPYEGVLRQIDSAVEQQLKG